MALFRSGNAELVNHEAKREADIYRAADKLQHELLERHWKTLQDAIPRGLRRELEETEATLTKATSALAGAENRLAAHRGTRPATIDDIPAWSTTLRHLESEIPHYTLFVREAQERRNAIAQQARAAMQPVATRLLGEAYEARDKTDMEVRLLALEKQTLAHANVQAVGEAMGRMGAFAPSVPLLDVPQATPQIEQRPPVRRKPEIGEGLIAELVPEE